MLFLLFKHLHCSIHRSILDECFAYSLMNFKQSAAHMTTPSLCGISSMFQSQMVRGRHRGAILLLLSNEYLCLLFFFLFFFSLSQISFLLFSWIVLVMCVFPCYINCCLKVDSRRCTIVYQRFLLFSCDDSDVQQILLLVSLFPASSFVSTSC